MCRKYKPEALLSFTLKPMVICSFVGAIFSVKNRVGIFTGLGSSLGSILERNDRKSQSVKWLMKRLFKFFTKIIVQNNCDRDLVAEFFSDQSKIILVNGSGVDLERFQFTPLPELPLKFLYVGRFTESKGLLDLLDAYEILNKKDIEFELMLVGDQGEDNEISVEFIESYNHGHITVYKFTSVIEQYITRAHVLILPSYREGTPRCIIEGFAVGRPCIVTDVPGCQQLVPDNSKGLLVEPRNPKALARAMERIIYEGDELHKITQSCRSFAETSFCDKAVNKIIVSQIL
jgi:glycosyltransferase involved in cell wall biosynthesis